jgi:hypothetical protein
MESGFWLDYGEQEDRLALFGWERRALDWIAHQRKRDRGTTIPNRERKPKRERPR